MLLFNLDHYLTSGNALSESLSERLSPLEIRTFPDGECKVRPLIDPAGADAYILHGLYGEKGDSPHDKLFRVLMLASALRDHGADRVTVVAPYMAYARKDRVTKSWDPLSLRCVSQAMAGAGVGQLIVLEAHNPGALQNASPAVVRHVDGYRLFDGLVRRVAQEGPVAVASPDIGGAKRVLAWQEHIDKQLGTAVGFALVDKRRSEGVVHSDSLVAGNVQGRTVLLLDDLIASGETMVMAARALRDAGASRVIACAVHCLWLPGTERVLMDDAFAEVVVSDSIPASRLDPDSALRRKLSCVSCWHALADAISHSHGAWRR